MSKDDDIRRRYTQYGFPSSYWDKKEEIDEDEEFADRRFAKLGDPEE